MGSTQPATIAAIATPPGRGGVGIVRVSGPNAAFIARHITGQTLSPRYAHYGPFYGCHAEQPTIIDQGIALFFSGPHSFTGEDILELQGHGGPVVLDQLLQTTIALGAVIAKPGEFSERAFLNDKIDLAQAEAIADLIDATSEQAARNAVNSLQGVFSEKINELVFQLTQLRIYVEAAIDFPEEEIDFLNDGKVGQQLSTIQQQLQQVFATAKQGVITTEGMKVVIAGKPNAGKSSLLNALSGRDSAIVTDIAGTTRDVLREHIHIDGLPLHIIDTAGLRESPDTVEKIGIERALTEIQQADRILLIIDSHELSAYERSDSRTQPLWQTLLPATSLEHIDYSRLSVIYNKIDQQQLEPHIALEDNIPTLYLSAKTGEGLDILCQHLTTSIGYEGTNEGGFTARRRHLDALSNAEHSLQQANEQLLCGAGELLADDLRQCQGYLGQITGQLSADDLLGKIFSSFCIGK